MGILQPFEISGKKFFVTQTIPTFVNAPNSFSSVWNQLLCCLSIVLSRRGLKHISDGCRIAIQYFVVIHITLKFLSIKQQCLRDQRREHPYNKMGLLQLLKFLRCPLRIEFNSARLLLLYKFSMGVFFYIYVCMLECATTIYTKFYNTHKNEVESEKWYAGIV